MRSAGKGTIYMKTLKQMDNRELFCILSGEGDIVQQTLLKNILWNYKKKHPDLVGNLDEMDLAAIVAEMTAEA